MLKNNQWIIKGLATVFFLGLFGLLLFYFDTDLSEFGIMLLQSVLIGSFFGLLIAGTFSVLNPPDPLFENRYILQGCLWGLMISCINFVVDASQGFEISSIIINLIIGIGGGILFMHFTQKRRYKQLREKLLTDDKELAVLSASAQITNQQNDEERGLLVLTKDTIQFLSEDKGSLLNIKPNKAHPRVTRKTWFNIPGGIMLDEQTEIKNIAFPRYWVHKIGHCQ